MRVRRHGGRLWAAAGVVGPHNTGHALAPRSGDGAAARRCRPARGLGSGRPLLILRAGPLLHSATATAPAPAQHPHVRAMRRRTTAPGPDAPADLLDEDQQEEVLGGLAALQARQKGDDGGWWACRSGGPEVGAAAAHTAPCLPLSTGHHGADVGCCPGGCPGTDGGLCVWAA